MALLNLLLLPVLVALGLLKPDGDGGTGEGGGEPPADKDKKPDGKEGSGSGGTGAGSGGSGDTITLTKAEHDALQRQIKEARGDASKYRTNGIRAIAAALGVELPEGEDKDSDKALQTLQSRIDSMEKESRDNKIEAVFTRVANKVGVKPGLTLKYLKADGVFDQMDHRATDFEGQIEQAVRAAAAEEESLLVKQESGTPGQSGAEFTSSDGKTLDEKIEEARKSGNVTEVIRLKQLQRDTVGNSAQA